MFLQHPAADFIPDRNLWTATMEKAGNLMLGQDWACWTGCNCWAGRRSRRLGLACVDGVGRTGCQASVGPGQSRPATMRAWGRWSQVDSCGRPASCGTCRLRQSGTVAAADRPGRVRVLGPMTCCRNRVFRRRVDR